MNLDLRVDNFSIGTVSPSSDPQRFRALPAADGLVLEVPFAVNLRQSERLCGYVSNLRLGLLHKGVHVGTGESSDFIFGNTDSQIGIRVRLSSDAIATIERQRNGGPLVFDAELAAWSGAVLAVSTTGGSREVLSRPQPRSVNTEIKLDRDRWAELRRTTRVGDAVVVELPLPVGLGEKWEAVLAAIRKARTLFEHGGLGAWKATVSECRNALEIWRDFEQVTLDPKKPFDEHTSEEGREVLRRDLFRYASQVVHGDVDRATREEAAMVLAAVVGLVAVRTSR